MESLFFQYCQKIIIFNEDFSELLLAKRQGEQDFDGVFTFIGGKLETTDGGFVEGLRREKNEEIGEEARVAVLPTVTYNVYFQKKDGSHMVLPHYAAVYRGGDIIINEEYSEFAWVKLTELEEFNPKIDNIPHLASWAKKIVNAATDDEWVEL